MKVNFALILGIVTDQVFFSYLMTSVIAILPYA